MGGERGRGSCLDVLLDATLRDDPNLGEAVLGGSGEDVVVEGVEVEVEDGTLVAREEGDGVVTTEVTNLFRVSRGAGDRFEEQEETRYVKLREG